MMVNNYISLKHYDKKGGQQFAAEKKKIGSLLN
jgi:hypothetical protein